MEPGEAEAALRSYAIDLLQLAEEAGVGYVSVCVVPKSNGLAAMDWTDYYARNMDGTTIHGTSFDGKWS